jgi:hypothetical protein
MEPVSAPDISSQRGHTGLVHKHSAGEQEWSKYHNKLLFIQPAELTQWYRVLLDKLRVLLILNKYSEFYRIRSFITLFTRTRHWFLS